MAKKKKKDGLHNMFGLLSEKDKKAFKRIAVTGLTKGRWYKVKVKKPWTIIGKRSNKRESKSMEKLKKTGLMKGKVTMFTGK